MIASYRWENSHKKRYYCLILAQDLFGDWVITKVWGGINKASGRIVHLPCPSYEIAHSTIEKIARTREKRGYILCR